MNPATPHRTLWIIDTTLRDGEQAPGVAFAPDTKVRLARLLDLTGVDEIEAGIPAMGKAEAETIARIGQLPLTCRVTAWCRSLSGDIELAARCGTEAVHISFPASKIHWESLGKPPGWVLEQLEGLISLARRYFDYVSVGAQDAFRGEPAFVKTFVRRAAACGAHRVRLADTVGVASPARVYGLIRGLLPLPPSLDIDFHGHNDLGMATANAITAAEAGAHALSVTVNGLGERAGNAALEEVALALKLCAGRATRVRPDRLADLCDAVAKASRRPIPAGKPVVGAAVFRHESGIHCRSLLTNPLSYQPFLPSVIGREKMEFVIGKHSGTAAIRHLLESAGRTVTEPECQDLLEGIRQMAAEKEEGLSLAELLGLQSSGRC